MKAKKHIIEKAIGDQSIKIIRKYINNGLRVREIRGVQTESDFSSSVKVRYSDDNGKTFSEYENNDKYYRKDGDKEILEIESDIIFNKVNNHIIKLVMERVFLYNHKNVYKDYFENGKLNWCDHVYLKVSTDNGKTYSQSYKLEYEKNVDIRSNLAYFGNNIEVDESGNIYTAIVSPCDKCCKVLNIESSKIASNPSITSGVFVFIGEYNKNTNKYSFTFSKPIVIEDYKSSRGLLEPNIIFVNNNELLLECRGSNVVSKGWNTRMLPDTPSYRWISTSNNNGKSFSIPKPMTFDNNDKFYSPSSMSKIFKHSLSNRLFWLGNINKEIPNGNRPRYPLYLCEIDKDKKCLIKDTLILIDEKLANESELIQFSNFNIYEDRVSNNIHIEYSRLGDDKNLKWHGDAIRIVVTTS